MLLDSFFYILHTEGGDADYKVKIGFNPEHDIFKGHFPGMPVVPGVCQVEVLRETLSKLLSKELIISTASSIKFLAVIEPLKTKELTMSIKLMSNEGNKLFVSADYHNDAETFFRFKGELSAA